MRDSSSPTTEINYLPYISGIDFSFISLVTLDHRNNRIQVTAHSDYTNEHFIDWLRAIKDKTCPKLFLRSVDEDGNIEINLLATNVYLDGHIIIELDDELPTHQIQLAYRELINKPV